MKRTEKLSILISIVLISLLAISAASAADTDEPTLSETSTTSDAVSEPINPTTTDVVSEPTTNDVQAKDTQDTTTVKSSDSKPVKADPTPGNFTDLDNDVRKAHEAGATTINLNKNYTYNTQEKINIIKIAPTYLGQDTLTINGNGYTINGNGGASIFQINNAMNVIINNLKIINAKEGIAAITVSNNSQLTLNNVTFINNTGGAINSLNSKLTIKDSTFINNTISEESIDDKPKIFNLPTVINSINGTITIENSEFINNSMSYVIQNINGTTRITDSEFIRNGFIITSRYDDTIELPKIGNNLDDLSSYADVFIKNSTFIDNMVISIGINLDDSDSDDIQIMPGINHNLVFITNSTFQIDDYAYDGPEISIYANDTTLIITDSSFEKVMPIFLNSSRLGMNTVKFIECSYEDDGVLYANNTVMIMNAIDFINNTDAIDAINSIIAIANSNFTNTTCSAIEAANSTIGIVSSNFTNSKTEDMPGYMAIYIKDNSTLKVEDAKFINSVYAIYAEDSDIEINKALFENNTYYAIHIYNENATELTINNTDFINNYYAIEAYLADININTANFVNNTNAISVRSSNLTVTEGYFINHTQGAILASTGNVTIFGGAFEGNEYMSEGGGTVTAYYVNLIIRGTEFTNNTAPTGGAICIIYSNATVEGTFTNNTALGEGGAIFIEDSNVEKIIGDFTGNTAQMGGAIYIIENSNATITGKFIKNNAYYGGAIANTGKITIKSSTFTENIADTIEGEANGGAIYNGETGTITIDNTKFEENYARTYGGAIYNQNDGIHVINITNSNFKNDNAKGESIEEFEELAREIYTVHKESHFGSYYLHDGHTPIIKITDSFISNVYAKNIDYTNETNDIIQCYGCVDIQNTQAYNMVPKFKADIISNVTDNVAILFLLVDEDGNLIDGDANGNNLINFTLVGNVKGNATNGIVFKTTLDEGTYTFNVTYTDPKNRFAPINEQITLTVTKGVKKLEEALKEAESKIKELEGQLLATELLYNQTRDQLTETQEKLRLALINASTQQQTIDDLNERIKELKYTIEVQKELIANLTYELNETQKNLTATQAQLNAANANLNKAQTDLATKETTINNLNNQITTLKTTNDQLNKDLETTKTQLTNAEAKISKVKVTKKVKTTKKNKKITIATVKLNQKVKGKYVYFASFNGKTYRVKTDKNGNAKLKMYTNTLKKMIKKGKKSIKINYQIIFAQKMYKKSITISKK